MWPTLGGRQLWADERVAGGYRIQRFVLGPHHHRLLDPEDRWVTAGSFAHCSRRLDAIAPASGSRHAVVLLHGIFRSSASFKPLLPELAAGGFSPLRVDYPSTRRPLVAHLEQVERVLDRLEGAETVSFVGHSLGGVLIRHLLARRGAWQRRLAVGRWVTCGTPHHGAEVAEWVGRVPTAGWVAGPALAELSREAARRWPPGEGRFGLVIGRRGTDAGFNPLLSGDNDFTVSAASARLEGAEDLLEVSVPHTFLHVAPSVRGPIVHYLTHGRFFPTGAPSGAPVS